MIVAGFGFREKATIESLRDALAATGAEDVEMLAIPLDKSHADCFTALVDELSLPVSRVNSETLRSMDTATQSAASQTHRGTGSVAEACALAAAGSQAELVTHRQVSSDRLATCAIAIGASA
ncbi:cobalamin biosynthesis protein [uncultured Shimia sp.]|uniref:cobalamin biosynthesis protein n=1 Tax=uncultured Shimia sp. TaxID=573152 RepID=UPI00261ACD15|nr:cobalamin biosynthesis protein [uncultured Shimia sp.]